MKRNLAEEFFNELLDMTFDVVENAIAPELQRIAKEAVKNARVATKASAREVHYKTNTRANTRTRTHSQTPPRTTPPPTWTTPQQTLYDTLEVSVWASQEIIDAAYKWLVKRHHPDVGGNEEKMKEITAAYRVLKDVKLREQYNKTIGVSSKERKN